MKAQTASSTESSFSATDLTERTIHRRAIEAVIWGMPAVNAELMFQAMTDAKADFNEVTYWSRTLTSKNQTLTPNPDTIYLNPFYNTRDVGPIVLEIPPADADASITGSVDDAWQTAIEDVGPAGVDKGKGGRYAILPPGHKDKLPEGFIPMPSATYTGFAILRSNIKSGSDADIARAVEYGKGIKVYPLSQAANPPETKFADVIDTVFDSTIPYDLRFFQMLDRFIQREPWLERDKAMIGTLKTIGIEKGKLFTPDEKTKSILNDAIAEAHAYLDSRYTAVFDPPFNEGMHWALPAFPDFAEAIMSNYIDPNSYPIEHRAVSYAMAYFSTKHLGTGQYYLMTAFDKDGKPFDGGSTYRLNVPANPPVKLYWSATAYDRDTHALIRDMKWASRSSHTPGLQNNTDGSIDVYFGPKATEGKETNWVPTNTIRGFEVLFRLYGPTKDFFEKKWVLPDIEKVD